MKCFHCDSCGMMVFFENDRCVKCDHALGFLPDVLTISALENSAEKKCLALAPPAMGQNYRHCANETQHHACNWMIPESTSDELCVACRLNELIPDLSDNKNLLRWIHLERAKRRCIYLFLKLRLPLEGDATKNQASLKFRFLQDAPNAPVKTGHDHGVITINIAEADDDEREHRRLAFHEPYRTLVGHLRHESGHYYWDRLIANSPNLKRFRELFGDETTDYAAALKAYYEQGPAPDWADRTVTAYASAHPWEDWAETWAHYLHITDTMETAASFGVSVNSDNRANNGSAAAPIRFTEGMDLESILKSWIPLTCALNSLNRGMGLTDLYPFVISPAVTEKLRFIHAVIQGATPANAMHKQAGNDQSARVIV